MEKKPNNVDFLAKCSVCDSSLNPDRIVVISEKEQKTVLHVACVKCNSKTMVFLLNNQNGIVSIGLATDLDADEVREKTGKEAISTDEIIDLHQNVMNKNIDIVKLIKSI